MRNCLPFAAILAILVPDATALACRNGMPSTNANDGRHLLALAMAGAIAHGFLLPLMATRVARVGSLVAIGLGSAAVTWALGYRLDEIALRTMAVGYSFFCAALASGLVRPRESATAETGLTVPVTATPPSNEATPQAEEPHHSDDRAA